ncbi:hypothetical protein SORBI_3003G032500 [Sorghum bicolor]|uniref:Uncharacterized protein n=1 Tax=Sorghum bicolor TaxID=4558 RepID=A0A1B6Q129_SORBI|nr:hypothetical protein SORBI_3003G032500 [Sorghum bicolor]
MGAFRLLFGKAQRSLVTARALTSASSLECRCAPPISRASPAMALCGVVATGSSPRHDVCLPVRASLRRGRVQVWLRAVWRRPARLGIPVGAPLPPPRASPGAAPRGVAAADTLCSGENALACLRSSRASPA